LIHNAKVYLLARNEEKARQAIEELKAETNGKEAIWIPLNLASLQSVKSAAETFLRYLECKLCNVITMLMSLQPRTEASYSH
jgi:NAD(P)-dependent dehydrogenase (short-subunit alcohol dehydrogenase family)